MNQQYAPIQKKRTRTLFLAELSMFVALTVIMSLTPLGYLPINPLLKLSLLMVPVTIGAAMLGPVSGLILGLIFGLTSFFQCLGTDAFGVLLFAESPLKTFLTCVPTRMLAGYLSGLTYYLLAKHTRLRGIASLISCAVGSYLNTALFCGCLVLCFRNLDISALGTAITVVAASGFVQGLIEAGVAGVIGGAVVGAIARAQRAKIGA